MILDYHFNKFKGQFSLSYTKSNGGKGILTYEINKFKTFVEDEFGKYKNWNNKNCTAIFTETPKRFDFLTFLRELPQKDRDLITTKYSPQHYAFDIEVECGEEFPEPNEAKYPILTISIVNNKLDCLVLGIKPMDDPNNTLQTSYRDYLNGSKFYRNLNLNPKAKYVYFENEGDMIDYFLKNVVQKAPILTGWNCLGFDWTYIVNRIKNYFPDIPLNKSSMIWQTTKQGYRDFRGDKHELNVPCHTLILDMMDIIDADYAVMPQKESKNLDYIASESPVGLHKIQYDGDLQKLYENDYPKYVFYNAIDSALVQLIDKAFGTLGNFETQAQYCGCKISDALSKIKLTETLFFNYFYENDIKIVPPQKFEGERGELLGAYVRTPTPGKHKYVCCNDFASLYPSTIITCNLSIENFIGNLADFSKNIKNDSGIVDNLADFSKNIKNDSGIANKFTNDKRFFISVNGNIYKNDKDYSFKIIQKNLKTERGKSKYLSKQLDASVMKDIEHIEQNKNVSTTDYPNNVVNCLKELGYSIKNGNDIKNLKDLTTFKLDIENEIRYLSQLEQAIKYLMNSMYGGSSHVAFAFFNMALANDITGEARNLIHMMESHIPQLFRDNWVNMKDLHNSLNICLKSNVALKDTNVVLKDTNEVSKDTNIALKDTNEVSIDTIKDYVELIYGDTDSLYISYEKLLNSIKGVEEWSTSKVAKFLVDLNEKFLNEHNKTFIENYYKNERNCRESIHEFELETVNLSGVWLDVKKRYAQILLWKDGKYYDEDNLPLKVKGLEIVKSSYPKFARNLIKGMVITLLSNDDKQLNFILNREMQLAKQKYFEAELESICPTLSINGYFKYVLDDSSTKNLNFALKTPAAVKGLAMYNAIRQEYNLPGEPDYNGKHRWYIIDTKSQKKNKEELRFCFKPGELPKWAEKYAPIDRKSMFEKMVLDPVNRIIVPCGLAPLGINGEIQFDLFGSFC